MKVMQILHAHNVMLNILRKDLMKIDQKLDRIDHRLAKEVVCVNAFQSVAREVTRRKRELEEEQKIEDGSYEVEVLVEK